MSERGKFKRQDGQELSAELLSRVLPLSQIRWVRPWIDRYVYWQLQARVKRGRLSGKNVGRVNLVIREEGYL